MISVIRRPLLCQKDDFSEFSFYTKHDNCFLFIHDVDDYSVNISLKFLYIAPYILKRICFTTGNVTVAFF